MKQTDIEITFLGSCQTMKIEEYAIHVSDKIEFDWYVDFYLDVSI